MELEQLIALYGYPAIIVGTLLEGEVMLLAAAMLASSGLLSLPGVMTAAIAGSLAGDQIFFRLGRRYGNRLLEKRPSWREKSCKLFNQLHHHQVWVIMGFRFVYGFRAVTPIVIGAGQIKPVRFTLLNMIGASAWVILFTCIGYYAGPFIIAYSKDIILYSYLVFIPLLFSILLALTCILNKYHKRK